jgi:hypothetical protein
MQEVSLQHDKPTRAPISRAWPIAPLAALFLGPLLAPLFQASSLPLVSDAGLLAHDTLSRYVCPTPAKSFALLGFPMAVCARCWGATIGLWAAWLLLKSWDAAWLDRSSFIVHRSTGSGFSQRCAGYLAWPLGLSLAIGALLLWKLEINAWPGARLPVLLLNGVDGGFWFGLFLGTNWERIGRYFQRLRAAHPPA